VDVIASFSAALRIDFSRATASIKRSDVIKRMIAIPEGAFFQPYVSSAYPLLQKLHHNNAKLAEFFWVVRC
jgi:hypothetical protein